jgi:hypothetical protein
MRLLTILCLMLPLAAQAGLYKCLDNAGRVTYTNAICDKAGLKEAKLIPPPPPPAIDLPKARLAQPAKPPVDKPADSLANKEAATPKLALNRTRAPDSGNCGKLNEQIGQVMDEMDEARRTGHTARQDAEWDDKLSRMQTEKNRLGCF